MGPVAAQAVDPLPALQSHLGAPTRLWTSSDGSTRRTDGRIQFLHDSMFTVWTATDAQLLEFPVRSLDRMAIVKSQSAFIAPGTMVAGTLAGAGAGFFATRRVPPADRLSKVRLRTVTLSAVAGAYAFFWIGELVIPETRWVTVFRR